MAKETKAAKTKRLAKEEASRLLAAKNVLTEGPVNQTATQVQEAMDAKAKDVPMPGVPFTPEQLAAMGPDDAKKAPVTIAGRLDAQSDGLGMLATERAKAGFEGWDELPGEVQDGIVTWAAIGLLVEVNAKQGELTVKAREELETMDSALCSMQTNHDDLAKAWEERGKLISGQAKEIVRLGGDASAHEHDDGTLHGSVDNLKI